MHHTVLLVSAGVLALLVGPLGAAPVRYDQRQDGEFNVHAHLENFVILLIPSGTTGLLDFVAKAAPGKIKHVKAHSSGGEKVQLELVPDVVVAVPQGDDVVASSAPLELPKAGRTSSPVVLHEPAKAPKALLEDDRLKLLGAGLQPLGGVRPQTRSSKLLAPSDFLSALRYGLSPASE